MLKSPPQSQHRILVTGGAGFLGTHLCMRLLDEGYFVYCLDNLYTGALNNIRTLLGNINFRFIQQNVQEYIDLEVDGIFNLACPASPVHYQNYPVETIKTSFLGALNVLELAKRNNCTVLQASTSEIYGDPITTPQSESYWGNVNPIGIRACYDEGKRAAETLFMDYHRNFGIDIRIARIFNTYGPLMKIDDGRVVSNFIVQALKGEDLTIYGDGKHTRSLCYVDDLIAAILKFYRQKQNIGPINLGNPNSITINELAKEIIDLCESDSQIAYSPLPKDDPSNREPDIKLAKQLLNWNPIIDREQGLKKTIDYFKTQLIVK
jgi:UDP-glucuronate decarboxylase